MATSRQRPYYYISVFDFKSIMQQRLQNKGKKTQWIHKRMGNSAHERAHETVNKNRKKI